MCGIFGEIGVLSDLAEFEDILNKSGKRGPDDQQILESNQNVRFGFNRLSILDLSEAGRQPMWSQDERWLVMMNGELYNHLELRARIKEVRWKGHSDAETLTEAIAMWGFEKTLFEIDGMFAIAAWNVKEKRLFLARDFAGIKPLFFGWNDQTFIFSSQYDQIMLHSACCKKELNPAVLRLYLEQHFMPAPFGLYQNTAQLEPGEWMSIDLQIRQQKSRYWDFPEWVESDLFDEDKSLEWLDYTLSNSVKAEMLSDVPLGAFLSGGIDSPLITFFANRQTKEPLKAFSIGSDSPIHDESSLAIDYAKQIGVEHTLERMNSQSALAYWDNAMSALHEPIGDFSLLPTYLVSYLAAKQVTVALSGDGGDELFFGYERFWSILKNPMWHHIPWAVRYGIYGIDRLLTKNQNINGGLLSKSPGHAHRKLHSRFTEGQIESVIPSLRDISPPENYRTYAYVGKNKDQILQQMRRAEFYGMMQKTLRKVDLASMENSLEVRVPFLKKSFIEASFRINPHLSYGANQRKTLLKKLLISHLPKSPIDPVKRGFSIPLSKWIRKELKEPFRDLFEQKHLLQHYGFSKKGIDLMLVEHENGQDAKWPLFTMYALLDWKRKL